MGTELNMFLDIVNICVSVLVIVYGYMMYNKTSGAVQKIILYSIVTVVIIALIEITGFLQVFPRDSVIQDLLYETDVLMSLLLLAIISTAASLRKR